MRILEDLYYGNIDLHIQRDQSDAQLRKIQALLIRDEDKMRSMLDKEQKDWFERCKELGGELSELQEREMFTKGFCLAVRIMAEVMNTMGVPDIDE